MQITLSLEEWLRIARFQLRMTGFIGSRTQAALEAHGIDVGTLERRLLDQQDEAA